MKNRLLWFVIGVLISGASICFADENLEPEERYKTKSKEYKVQTTNEEDQARKLNVLCSFNQYVGYDNNVYLDSSRKGDMFLQTVFRLGIEHPGQDMKLKLTYNLFSVAYTEITDASTVDNNFNLNVQKKLAERNVLEFNYNFSILDFPKDDPGDYRAHGPALGFKRHFTDRFFGRLGYGYLNKGFRTQKARYADGTESNSKRDDNRHIADLEFGYYLWKKALLKLRGRYHHNDSNYAYYDYYDYSSSLVGLNAIYIFSEKIFGSLAISEKFKNYDHRPTLNRSRTQKDQLFTINPALFYNFTPSISISLNVIYRENDSNEPREEYTETISLAGFQYSF